MLKLMHLLHYVYLLGVSLSLLTIFDEEILCPGSHEFAGVPGCVSSCDK